MGQSVAASMAEMFVRGPAAKGCSECLRPSSCAACYGVGAQAELSCHPLAALPVQYPKIGGRLRCTRMKEHLRSPFRLLASRAGLREMGIDCQ